MHFENTARKAENAGNHYFLVFTTLSKKSCIIRISSQIEIAVQNVLPSKEVNITGLFL